MVHIGQIIVKLPIFQNKLLSFECFELTSPQLIFLVMWQTKDGLTP